MRRLSIIYIVLALCTLGTVWRAYRVVHTDPKTLVEYYQGKYMRAVFITSKTSVYDTENTPPGSFETSSRYSDHTEWEPLGLPTPWLSSKVTKSLDLALTFALVFVIIVFFGEEYQVCNSRCRSIPISAGYIVMAMVVVSEVITPTCYLIRIARLLPYHRITQTTVSTVSTQLLWAMAYTGAFVVLVIVGEIDMRRSRAKLAVSLSQRKLTKKRRRRDVRRREE